MVDPTSAFPTWEKGGQALSVPGLPQPHALTLRPQFPSLEGTCGLEPPGARSAAVHACGRPGAGGPRRRLTFVVLAGRVVEGEPQGDDGGVSRMISIVLEAPHELQEGFWLLWRYKVLPKNLLSLLQVWSSARQTYRQSAERLAWGSWGRHTCPGITPRGGRGWQGEERQKQGRKPAGTHQGACTRW